MKKRLLISLLLSVCLSAGAQVVTKDFYAAFDIDQPQYIWHNGEPQIGITIRNTVANRKEFKCELQVFTHRGDSITAYEKWIEIDSHHTEYAHFTLSGLPAPGFYLVKGLINGSVYASHVIGYKPLEIPSEVYSKEDFDHFWSETRSMLDSVDPDFKITPLPEMSTAVKNAYLVEMKTLPERDGREVVTRALLLEPVAEGRYPCVISFFGYGTTTLESHAYRARCNPGWCEIVFWSRGQGINGREPYGLENAFYGKWFEYQIGNRDAYYYRGAFADTVRAFDLALQRPKVDTDKIFARGASQGGLFSLVLAGMEPRLKGIGVGMPFMCGMEDVMVCSEWVRGMVDSTLVKWGWNQSDILGFFSYFDPVNFAPDIKCPVTVTTGLDDPVVTPQGVAVLYNLIGSERKSITYVPEGKHNTPEGWGDDVLGFFQSVIDGTGVEEMHVPDSQPDKIFNLQGLPIGPDAPGGIRISKGKKFVGLPQEAEQ